MRPSIKINPLTIVLFLFTPVSCKPFSFQEIPIDQARYDMVRRKDYVYDHPDLKQRIKDLILNGKISLGMTTKEVEASWGPDHRTNRSVGSWGVHEQWIYLDRYYLYFENGVLTSWDKTDY